MQRFRFGQDVAWPISDYRSSFQLVRLLQVQSGEVRIDIAYFGAGDRVGPHPAGLPQLFCVISGDGWVTGEESAEARIATGEAAFWSRGEQHSARTDPGMIAIIIQAEGLNPAVFLENV